MPIKIFLFLMLFFFHYFTVTKAEVALKAAFVSMFTSLYEIDLGSDNQKQITFPKENELDEDPQSVGSYLTWIRRQDEIQNGDVWIKHDKQKEASIWIENVDFSPAFFKK